MRHTKPQAAISPVFNRFSWWDRQRLRFAASEERFAFLIEDEIARNPLRSFAYFCPAPLPFPGAGTIFLWFTIFWHAIQFVLPYKTDHVRRVQDSLGRMLKGKVTDEDIEKFYHVIKIQKPFPQNIIDLASNSVSFFGGAVQGLSKLALNLALLWPVQIVLGGIRMAVNIAKRMLSKDKKPKKPMKKIKIAFNIAPKKRVVSHLEKQKIDTLIASDARLRIDNGHYMKHVLMGAFLRAGSKAISRATEPYFDALHDAREKKTAKAWGRFLLTFFTIRLNDKALLKPFSKKKPIEPIPSL